MLPGTEVANLNAYADARGNAEVRQVVARPVRRKDLSPILPIEPARGGADVHQSARSVLVILRRLQKTTFHMIADTTWAN